MKEYEVLEHSADLKIKVFGGTKEKLFENALRAMAECLRPKVQKKVAQAKIRILSENIESLLVDFLNEVNYLSEINREVYDKIRFEKFSEREIIAEISGREIARFGLQIKGVTFHNLDVHQNKDRIWEATILFDI